MRGGGGGRYDSRPTFKGSQMQTPLMATFNRVLTQAAYLKESSPDVPLMTALSRYIWMLPDSSTRLMNASLPMKRLAMILPATAITSCRTMKHVNGAPAPSQSCLWHHVKTL